MQNIIIAGAGGHGIELYSYLQSMHSCGKAVRCLGFVDDDRSLGSLLKPMILGAVADLPQIVSRLQLQNVSFITAIGNNHIRQHLVSKIEALAIPELLPWTLHHCDTYLGYDTEVGDGSCLAPGAIITARTRIGKHVILNVKASVSHDCNIGDYVNINPSATVCGSVNIGTGCYIGAGAVIKDHVAIGDWTVVGAGAIVLDDLPANVTAVGVPARVIKHHQV